MDPAGGRKNAFGYFRRSGRRWGTAFVRGIFTIVAFLSWVTGGFYRREDPGVFQGRETQAGAPKNAQDVKKILLIRMDLLGDVILTMPAVAALRKGYPLAHITMLVLPYTAPALDLFPYVDRVVTFDINKLRPSGDMLNLSHYRDLWRLLHRLRQERYDLAVSFYGLYAGILALISGARLRIGYRGEGCPFLFNLPVPGRRYEVPQHEVEYDLALARAAGACETLVALTPAIPEEVKDRALALLSHEGVGPQDLLVAIHPGSTNGTAKRWTIQGWAALADRVATELGAGVIFNGVASEMPLVREITGRMKTTPVVMAGKTSIPELAYLLTRCRVLVTGDSAPLHLAWSLGVPVVGLYGPTDPVVSGPYGGRSVVLRKEISCSPCYDLLDTAECRRESVACMEAITEEEVFTAVKRALQEFAPASQGTRAE